MYSEEDWRRWVTKYLIELKVVYDNSPKRVKEDYGNEAKVSSDYKGRAILELLQNSDDAQIPEREVTDKIGPPEIYFVLKDTTLYCANGGYQVSMEGFDAIGGNHVRKYLSPEVRAKIMSQKNIFENSLRLFNKEDYGYYRTTKKETVKKIYPKGSNIPLDYLEAVKKHKNIDKIFNQEQQGLEAVNLRSVVKEQHEVLKYLNKKEFVDKNDIKSLGNIKNKK